MQFRILDVRRYPTERDTRDVAYLTSDRWNDFGYRTQRGVPSGAHTNK